MGKLYSSKTYLVGAMDRVLDGGVEWREWITPKLHEMGVMVHNPCDKLPAYSWEDRQEREIRGAINQLKKERKYNQIKQDHWQMRSIDLRMVDTSDFIIANIDIDVHACGTYEEIVTANRQKKPILVHCSQGKENAPNWLFLMLPHIHIFDTWNNLLAHLEYIDLKGNDSSDRWILFDMTRELEAIRNYG